MACIGISHLPTFWIEDGIKAGHKHPIQNVSNGAAKFPAIHPHPANMTRMAAAWYLKMGLFVFVIMVGFLPFFSFSLSLRENHYGPIC